MGSVVKEDKKINYGNDILNRYRILSVIKKDDKGTVYLAEHKTMAVKRIIKSATNGTVYAELLLNEAAILLRLNYCYIPRLCDVLETEQEIFLVLEYIEGKTLYEYVMENGKADEKKVLSYGIMLAQMVDYLHNGNSLKVCHLDIQPKNIIIKNERLFLIDFGNSRCEKEALKKSAVMATEGFAPLWQYENSFLYNEDLDSEADIFGIGAVMLFMLTGKTLKYSDKILDIYDCVKNSGQKTGLRFIISNMINPDISCRQSDIKQVKKQLEALASDEDVCDIYKSDKEISNSKISVAGVKRGVGTTYISLGLTYALKQTGFETVYEENNDSGLIRSIAKVDKNIIFNKGYFVLGEYRMKPLYGQNVHLESEADIRISDEGIVSEDIQYGDMLLMVTGSDILCKTELDRSVDIIREKNITSDKVIIVFNNCNYEAYKKIASVIPYKNVYIPSGESVFTIKKNNAVHMLRLAQAVCKETDFKNDFKKQNKRMGCGNKKHRNSIG